MTNNDAPTQAAAVAEFTAHHHNPIVAQKNAELAAKDAEIDRLKNEVELRTSQWQSAKNIALRIARERNAMKENLAKVQGQKNMAYSHCEAATPPKGHIIDALTARLTQASEQLALVLGLHPDTEYDSMLKFVDDIRAEARNYPELQLRLAQAKADAKVLRAEVKAWREHAANPVGGVRELEVSAAVAATDASGAMTRGGGQ